MKETNESRLLTTGVTRRKLVQTTLVGGLAMATGAFRYRSPVPHEPFNPHSTPPQPTTVK